MAFNDTLFQLGMDLTRSSTAQKEDHGEPARVISRSVVSEPAADRSEGTDGYKDRGAGGNSGSHLIIDLFGAKPAGLLRHWLDGRWIQYHKLTYINFVPSEYFV